jgi:hypothetical protein
LPITVGAIVGQPDKHGPVVVGQKGAVGRLAVLEDIGRPSVGQIDQGQTTPRGLLGVDHPLFTGQDLDGTTFSG